MVGAAYAEALVEGNPGAMVKGLPIPYCPRPVLGSENLDRKLPAILVYDRCHGPAYNGNQVPALRVRPKKSSPRQRRLIL